MGFEKFGAVAFTADSRVGQFVDYLEKGKVMATKCKNCGKVYFPPKADCPACLRSDVEWQEISGAGALLTYTQVNYGPSGFENDTPYTLGIGEFQDGVRVLARLSKDVNPADVKVGMKVELVPLKLAGERVSYEMRAG